MKYIVGIALSMTMGLGAKSVQSEHVSSTHLQKVFHHRMGIDSDALPHIELAKLVLYFDHDPIIKQSQQA